MPVDVDRPLRQALSKLKDEKARIERQIAGLEHALQAVAGPTRRLPEAAGAGPRKRGRKRMSPAERQAVGARMKAYWAKRRKAASKKGPTKKK
jgi:hypothetical protein